MQIKIMFNSVNDYLRTFEIIFPFIKNLNNMSNKNQSITKSRKNRRIRTNQYAIL